MKFDRRGDEKPGGAHGLFFGWLRRGGPDFPFEKIVQERPERDDRCQLTDFLPRRGNGGAQNIGGQLEFQCEGEPSPQLQAHVGFACFRLRRTDKEQAHAAIDRLSGGDSDNQCCARFHAISQVIGVIFEALIGFQGRGRGEVVPSDFYHGLFLKALPFQ